ARPLLAHARVLAARHRDVPDARPGPCRRPGGRERTVRLQRRERGRRGRVPRRPPVVPRDSRGRRGDARRGWSRPGARPGRPRRGRSRRARARGGGAGRSMTWLVVIGGLVLLVFLHELGHFSVALAVGMRPRSFYIGFPPALVKVRRKGIEYGIGMI